MSNTMLLEEIQVNSKYLRVKSNVDDLVKSIEKVGLINPLVINGENELLAGGRRYTALKKMGATEAEVVVVDCGELEQELISIDENLIRVPLSDVEFDNCLRRGKEIYNQLNPDAPKTEEDALVCGDEGENSSFPDQISDRIGVSPKRVWKAINRDEKSSTQLKQARSRGEVTTAQTNDLVKLDKSEQNEIIPYLVDAPSVKLKDVVKDVAEVGVDQAIKNFRSLDPAPKEFAALGSSSRRLVKLIEKIAVEQILYDGDDLEDIISKVKKAKNKLNEFLREYQE